MTDPSAVTTARQADPHSWFQRMHRGELPPPAVAQLLGARIRRVDVAAGEIEIDYEGSPSFANPAGGIQGGMLGAMLDDLTAALVDSTLAAGEVVATLALNLQFLRAARPGPIQGRARLQRRGSSVCNAVGELMQDGKLVATAAAVCTIVPAAKPKPQTRS